MNAQIRPLAHTLLVSLLLLGFCSVIVAADETVDVKRDANEDVEIYLSCINGSIAVKGWDRKELQITGTLEEDIEELKISGDAKSIDIEVEVRKGRNLRRTEAHLTLMVPSGCSAEISTVNADFEAVGLSGDLEVGTVNGDIDVASDLSTLRLQTVSGDLVLELAADRASLQSVSGDIELSGACRQLEVGTVSGDIDIEGGPWGEIDASSVSGDVEISAELAPDAEIEISTQSGTVTLHVPESFGAEYSLETFSGDIDADFGPRPKRKSRYAPGTEVDFRTGSGEAEIYISTFSGDIELLEP